MKRSSELELIDLGSSHYTAHEYQECLHQLGRIGRFLGGHRATLKAFRRLPRPSTILDVGCGGGQFTLALAQHFTETEVTGIDLSEAAIAFAQSRLQETAIKNAHFVVAASPELSYLPNSFDVVTATLVCHHMSDDQLIAFLQTTYQIAKQAIILNDLHRHPLSYACFAALAKFFFPNRLIYHDGLLSIRRAFTRDDWLHYLQAANIPLECCSVTWHWAFRWVVSIDVSQKSKL